MPDAFAKGCSHHGCPERVRGGVYCEKHQKEKWSRDAVEARDTVEQAFYSTKEWRELSRLIRAKEPFCREHLIRKGERVFGELTDHIIPLRLAWSLRLSPRNLQTLCHACHNIKRVEERGIMKKVELPKCTLVCGPPCSGKTKYAREMSAPGDLVYDFSEWQRAVAAFSTEAIFPKLAPYVEHIRDATIQRLVLEGKDRPRSWFCEFAPSLKRRNLYREVLGAEVVVLEATPDDCLRLARIKAEGDEFDEEEFRRRVAAWWQEYDSDPRDTVFKVSRLVKGQ